MGDDDAAHARDGSTAGESPSGTNADDGRSVSKFKPGGLRGSGGGLPLRSLLPLILLSSFVLLPLAAAADIQASEEVALDVGPLPSTTVEVPRERVPRQCFVVACVEEMHVGGGNVTPSQVVVVPVLARVHADVDVGVSAGVAASPYEAYPERAIVLAVPLAGPVVVRVCPAGCMVPVTPVLGADAGAGVRLEAGPWSPEARHALSL